MEEFAGRKIRVTHEYPPIPDRRFDYCAFFDGEEEGGIRGWGTTREAAIENFIENFEDFCFADHENEQENS